MPTPKQLLIIVAVACMVAIIVSVTLTLFGVRDVTTVAAITAGVTGGITAGVTTRLWSASAGPGAP